MLRPGISVALILMLTPISLAGQGFLEGFSYEGLRFSGVGFELGVVGSDRLTTELSGGVRVDYGMIAPRVRLLIGLSYFQGDLDADEIAEFETRLRGVVVDPSRDFSIEVGTISWSDLAADFDLQYLFTNRGPFMPYLGLGFGAHVRNGSGAAIEETFVEDALDTIDAGLNLSLGMHIAMSGQWLLTVDARGGLASELRTAALSIGAMYRVPR